MLEGQLRDIRRWEGCGGVFLKLFYVVYSLMASSNCNSGSSASSMRGSDNEPASTIKFCPDDWKQEPITTWEDQHMRAPLCYVCVPRAKCDVLEEEGFIAQRRHDIAVSLTQTAAVEGWAAKGGVGEFAIFAVLEDPDRYSRIPSLTTVNGHSLVFPLDRDIHIPAENMYRVMNGKRMPSAPAPEKSSR